MPKVRAYLPVWEAACLLPITDVSPPLPSSLNSVKLYEELNKVGLHYGPAPCGFLWPISGLLGVPWESPGTSSPGSCVCRCRPHCRVGTSWGRQSPPSTLRIEVPHSTSSWMIPTPSSSPGPAGLRTHSCCLKCLRNHRGAGAAIAQSAAAGPSFSERCPHLLGWPQRPERFLPLPSSLPPPFITALGSSFPT